jgi:hypothetical protein
MQSIVADTTPLNYLVLYASEERTYVETCRRMNIPVREYLAAVLPGLADTPIHSLRQLTPMAWSKKPNLPSS